MIDRIKAVTQVPVDATARVSFNAADHRLLSEVAQFGSLTESLVDRTRGGRTTLASKQELTGAIRALQECGESPHQMLAGVLAGAMPQESTSEASRPFDLTEGLKSEGGALLAKDTWRLNVARISVAQAIAFAEKLFRESGADVHDYLPNLEDHFTQLKRKMKHALNIQRIDMPVIYPKNIPDFAKNVKAGRVDIFAPFFKGHLGNLFPWERKGKPAMFGDEEWITLGVKDGDPNDDRVDAQVEMIAVKDLKPLQNEIWYDKLIASIMAFGVPKPGGFLATSAPIIVSKEGYILDGHHRFGQGYLVDPGYKLKSVYVPLDIDTLLKVGRSYGSAIGNHAQR